MYPVTELPLVGGALLNLVRKAKAYLFVFDFLLVLLLFHDYIVCMLL